MGSPPPADPETLEVLTIDRPEQLKALGHPLRLRVLEMLGDDSETQLTNRELAARIGVDPGHLHFHVRMLLRAGLIRLAQSDSSGRREKPYRAVARHVRVAPELLSGALSSGIQAAMLEEVQKGFSRYATEARFRSLNDTVHLPAERLMELLEAAIAEAHAGYDDDAETLVVSVFIHPPATAD
ncbi:MAG: ArsR/SmtB family transcription factor [Gaiellaceae bacterium]